MDKLFAITTRIGDRRRETKRLADKQAEEDRIAREKAESKHAIPQINLPPIQREILGREHDLQALRDGLLAQGHAALTAVVQGHGGYGKTALARLYVDRYGDTYDGILWATADPAVFLPMIVAAADSLGVTRTGDVQADARAVLARVGAQGRWLIVYDNVASYAAIKDMMPSGPHLIVTTRESEGWGHWPKVQPKTLPWDGPDIPAVDLLLAEAGSDDAPGAQALAQALGGLPLALIVAGALARHDSFGAVQTRIAEVLETAPRNDDYDDSVIGAVMVSYERLSSDAQRVIDILAWWAPEALGPDLFTGGVEGRRRALDPEVIEAEEASLSDDPDRLRSAFADLAAASLLQRAETGEGFTLHRMTAAALRAVQDRGQDRRAVRAAVELLAAVYPGGDKSPDYSPQWPLCARLTPHVSALWEVLETTLDSTTPTAPGGAALDYLLNQSSIYMSQMRDPAQLTLAQASLTLKEARLPPDHRDFALGLTNLAGAHLRQGAFDRAEALLDYAITLERAHRPGSVLLADQLSALGGLRMERARQGQGGDPELAAEAYEEALRLYRAQLGEDHDKVAMVLNNLAVLRDLQGRGGQAADLAGQALTIDRKALPPGDARLAFSLVNAGSLVLKAGQASQAEPLLKEGYDIRAAVHRPDHPDLRIAAGWLTTCWLVLAQQPGARGLYEARAKTLCAKHGLDFARQQAQADALIKQDAS